MPRAARGRRGPWSRPLLWIAAAFGATLLVGWLDWRTRADADLSLFYGAAVAGAGWWLGRRFAIAAGALAGAAWTLADLARRPPDDARFAFWNGLTHLVIFLFVGLAMARVRADRRRLGRSRRVLEEEILLARTDVVTDLPNARGFLERLDRELSDPQRRGLSLSLACIDIDGFHKYQDRHEASANEQLVSRIAGVLRRAIRASDIAARLDRDEFAIAFRDVEQDVVEKTLRRVIAGVAALGGEDREAPLSATVGVVCFADPPEDPQEALRRAEKTLHEAHAAEQALRFEAAAATESGGGQPAADPA
jgi:diguanylate cyclase (GGDEF)-like protein